MNDMPQSWADLIEALTLLAKHHTDETSPTQCSHDQMTVMSDSTKYTEVELAHLEKLGFKVSKEYGNFYSFRFGSA